MSQLEQLGDDFTKVFFGLNILSLNEQLDIIERIIIFEEESCSYEHFNYDHIQKLMDDRSKNISKEFDKVKLVFIEKFAILTGVCSYLEKLYNENQSEPRIPKLFERTQFIGQNIHKLSSDAAEKARDYFEMRKKEGIDELNRLHGR